MGSDDSEDDIYKDTQYYRGECQVRLQFGRLRCIEVIHHVLRVQYSDDLAQANLQYLQAPRMPKHLVLGQCPKTFLQCLHRRNNEPSCTPVSSVTRPSHSWLCFRCTMQAPQNTLCGIDELHCNPQSTPGSTILAKPTRDLEPPMRFRRDLGLEDFFQSSLIWVCGVWPQRAPDWLQRQTVKGRWIPWRCIVYDGDSRPVGIGWVVDEVGGALRLDLDSV